MPCWSPWRCLLRQSEEGWGTARQSCNSLLHNCPGVITSACWKVSSPQKSAAGTPTRLSNTAGAGRSSRTTSRGLLDSLRALLLEVGKGFAFVGSQYHLEIGDQDFFLDLLFYHLRLRCYVVIDLKIEEFKPEFAGKMNFYLSAVDDLLRRSEDQPSLGLILCKEHNRLVVEYALRDMSKPMGVAEYRLTQALPEQLQSELPTTEDLA